jgi:two-component system sensor kinase FixL
MSDEQPQLQNNRLVEARWRALIDSTVDGIVVIDSRGSIEVFNAAAQRQFGYTEREVIGQNVSVLMPEPDRSRHDGYLSHHLESGEKHVIGIGRAVTAQRRDGTTFPVHLSLGSYEIDGKKYFTGILHDLTRRAELEDRLREATALARLGEMAAVIAHEVKNPIAGVRGAIQILGGRFEDGSSDKDIVGEIIARLDGLNDLIQDLLVFARPPKPKMVEIDLMTVLRATGDMLKNDPAYSTTIEFNGSAPPLSCDPNLLTIVFQNLLINAAQAMQNEGHIRVALVADGDWHKVEIVDAGPGIPVEIRATLFRPFQTTKARGTGLGLATARRLIDLHGGRIAVTSPPAGGTTVHVELPSKKA